SNACPRCYLAECTFAEERNGVSRHVVVRGFNWEIRNNGLALIPFTGWELPPHRYHLTRQKRVQNGVVARVVLDIHPVAVNAPILHPIVAICETIVVFRGEVDFIGGHVKRAASLPGDL